MGRRGHGFVLVFLMWAFAPAAAAQFKVNYGAEVFLYHHSDTNFTWQTRAGNRLTHNLARLKPLRLAVVANQTSRVFDSVHVVDTLKALGYNLAKVFAPEHGFRGTAEAGDTVHDGHDARTGIAVLSLFGKKIKPVPDDLKDVDAVVFDVQDVGCRFYTYLSTLVLMMEACAENDKELVVLDRPNPNGWYMDGPVLDSTQRSFVGLHPVPIVYGLTLGEYALMVNARGWLGGGKTCKLTVVPALGYKHNMHWEDTGRMWVPPSPNLPTPASARFYPILCWYEGTVASVGRGTPWPFEVVGMPGYAYQPYDLPEAYSNGLPPFACYAEDDLEVGSYWFVPQPIAGKSANPLQRDRVCRGIRLRGATCSSRRLFVVGLELLAALYKSHRREPCGLSGTDAFFNPYVEKLIGSPVIKLQIISNQAPITIYDSWQTALNEYKVKAAPFVLYPMD